MTPKVSGPGKYAKRTDIPANGDYGYRKETAEIKAGAPLPKPNRPKVVPLNAPTEFPDQPVTDGLSVGPGFTPEPPVNNKYAMISKYMDRLDTLAAQPDAPEAFKVFLNFVKLEATKEQ